MFHGSPTYIAGASGGVSATGRARTSALDCSRSRRQLPGHQDCSAASARGRDLWAAISSVTLARTAPIMPSDQCAAIVRHAFGASFHAATLSGRMALAFHRAGLLVSPGLLAGDRCHCRAESVDPRWHLARVANSKRSAKPRSLLLEGLSYDLSRRGLIAHAQAHAFLP